MEKGEKKVFFKILLVNFIFIILAIRIVQDPEVANNAEAFAMKSVLILSYVLAMVSNLIYVVNGNFNKIMDFLRLEETEDDDDDWMEF